MTRLFLSFLICLFTFSINAQEHSWLTIGVAYPMIIDGKVDWSHSNYFIGDKSFNLFIEKPSAITFSKNENFYLTPGLSFVQFEESGEGGGLGGGSTRELKHKAYSIYLKLMYEIDLAPENSPNIYFGLHTGLYLHTRTSGTRDWWARGDDITYRGTEIINKSGKQFFNSMYGGFLFGFRPVIRSAPFIKPYIELSFFPYYIDFYDPHIEQEEQNPSKNMFQISIGIGFGTKSGNTSTE